MPITFRVVYGTQEFNSLSLSSFLSFSFSFSCASYADLITHLTAIVKRWAGYRAQKRMLLTQTTDVHARTHAKQKKRRSYMYREHTSNERERCKCLPARQFSRIRPFHSFYLFSCQPCSCWATSYFGAIAPLLCLRACLLLSSTVNTADVYNS